MLGTLSNREIATSIWILAIISFAVIKDHSILNSGKELLRLAISPKLSVPFLLIAVYVAAEVFILWSIDFWRPSLLKETIIWFLAAATSMALRVASHDQAASPILPVLADSCKLVLFLEFFLNVCELPIFLELLLIPAIALPPIIQIVLEKNAEVNDIRIMGCMTKLQIAVVAFLLLYSLSCVIVHLDKYFTPDIIPQLILPPMLSILFLPAVFIVHLAVQYENMYLGLKMGNAPNKVRRYTKLKLSKWACVNAHKAWYVAKHYRFALIRIHSIEDADRLLESIAGRYPETPVR